MSARLIQYWGRFKNPDNLVVHSGYLNCVLLFRSNQIYRCISVRRRPANFARFRATVQAGNLDISINLAREYLNSLKVWRQDYHITANSASLEIKFLSSLS